MMLRKLFIVSFVSGVVLYGCASKKLAIAQNIAKPAATNYKEIGAPLPPLTIYTKQGKYVHENDLKNDAHLILMIFNPTCDHCEDQTRLFKDNIFLFKQTKLMLVAGNSMLPYMEYFTVTTKTQDYPSIQMGVDSSEYIEKTYRQLALPQINIYDKNRKLVKVFEGLTPIDSLKKYID